MSNSILTISQITRSAVDIFKNSNQFIQNIERQYDDKFAQDGAKIGTALRIRLPNDYVVTDGPGLSAQDTSEQSVTLTVATQRHVDMAFSTAERTMSLDDYEERVLLPAMNVLAGNVAKTIMLGSEGGAANFVSNVDGANNIIRASADTVLAAGAYLSDNSAPSAMKKIVVDPWTEAKTVSTLSGLFNPSQGISEQYRTGKMKNALGFDWFMDQTVIKHTTGSFTAGTVNGAGQTGTALVVNAITGTFALGDIITIAGVYAVNRVTKQTTGKLRQFVLTAAAANGATGLTIYPAIIAAIGGADVQYQTVDTSPANAAAISLAHKAGETFRKAIAYDPTAITMATADLVMPKGVHEAARAVYDGISLRGLTAYVPGTDQLVTRMDVLFGSLWVRPEWVVAVGDVI